MIIVQLSCQDCGFVTKPASQARTEYAMRIHSCDRHRSIAERKRRAAEKLAGIDRTPKPCTHRRANHVHGTHAAYVLDRCRCLPCSKANTAYETRRVRQVAYGRWQPYVDAEPVRDHVQELMAAGMGLKRVAKVAGVSSGALSKLIYGMYRGDGTKRHPSTKVRKETADRLLAVRPDIETMAGAARVQAPGVARRLQALVALGWSQAKLAHELGVQPTNFTPLVHGRRDRLRVRTVRAVNDLYQRLSMTLPVERNQRERIAAARARNYAKAKGWLPPLAWDSDELDMPAGDDDGTDYIDEIAVERRMAGQRVSLTRPESAEVVARLQAKGWTDGRIESVTGLKPRSARKGAA